MKIYNVYILAVAVLLMLTTVVLVALGKNSLGIYYTSYIIEAIVVTELFVHFNAKARQGLSMVSAVLFAGLVFIVSLKVVDVFF